jgi:RNA 3'-terminal phosphate cyclase (ATP)
VALVELDGSRYSGSGTIVRQAVALAALTKKSVRIVNVRVKRPKPGLRRQHVQVVKAIEELVSGNSEGITPGSKEIVFSPGKPAPREHYTWDIGSAGSTTALAIAVLPVAAFSPFPVSAEIRGGLFQDFSPSFYHLENVLLPFLELMGIQVTVRMERPGYVPTGNGILHLAVTPAAKPLRPLVLNDPGQVKKIWGIALCSRLKAQRVSDRMAESAKEKLETAGYKSEFHMIYDESALQPGAALAAFADLERGGRIGSDRAGAPGRRSEIIGNYVARQLLEDIRTGAAIDRHASDQIIPFAALAAGESQLRIPSISDHVQSNAWLCETFLGAKIAARENEIVVEGIGLAPKSI